MIEDMVEETFGSESKNFNLFKVIDDAKDSLDQNLNNDAYQNLREFHT